MTLDELYHQSLKQLKNVQIEEINVRILLCEINGLNSMSDFYIHKDDEIKDLRRFNEYFERFLKGEPIQYILKKSNFYGYDFYVDKRVLIPRMESEEVISYAIDKYYELFDLDQPTIVDVCCGSGCLGITLSRCLNAKKLYLSDISQNALDVVKKNLGIHGLEGELFKGDCLSEVIKNNVKCDVLIANPPYIIKKEDVDEAVKKHEPHVALFSNKKLSVYDHIISNLTKVANKPFLAIFEIGYDIKPMLDVMVRKYLPKAEYEFAKDINGNFRILSIYLKK